MPIRVLFVCLGNICRSPMAESVFRHLVEQEGLDKRVSIDSAGTGSWHAGSPPHPETQQELIRNGIDVGPGRARQVTREDLTHFDYVVAMDSSNLQDLQDLYDRTPDAASTLSRLLDHARTSTHVDVPDPYYEGGFDYVFELVVDGCQGLLTSIVAEHQLVP